MQEPQASLPIQGSKRVKNLLCVVKALAPHAYPAAAGRIPRLAHPQAQPQLFPAERLQLQNSPVREQTQPELRSLRDVVLRLSFHQVFNRREPAAEQLWSHTER